MRVRVVASAVADLQLQLFERKINEAEFKLDQARADLEKKKAEAGATMSVEALSAKNEAQKVVRKLEEALKREEERKHRLSDLAQAHADGTDNESEDNDEKKEDTNKTTIEEAIAAKIKELKDSMVEKHKQLLGLKKGTKEYIDANSHFTDLQYELDKMVDVRSHSRNIHASGTSWR